MDTEIKKNHSVVVGMGSAGLASALNLLVLGHHVSLIDIRSDYTLKQKVRIPKELVHQFSAFEFDGSFLEKLSKKNYVTSLRKFQTYQFNILKDIYEQKKIRFKTGACKKITGTLDIFRGKESEIVTIDGDSQSLCLRDNTQLFFDILIDATGDKRHIATLLQVQSNEKYHIDYVSDLPQPDHLENAIIYFNAPVKSSLFITPENSSNNYYLSDFSDKNWKKDRAPCYYLGANSVKKRVYLLTEIPEELLNEQDHNQIINFAKPILQEECNIDVTTLNVQASDLKICSTFKIKHEITDKPYTILGHGGVCIVVGDAFSPANFHFGHGISKAIEDGNNLAKVFKNNQFNSDKLESRARDIREEFKLRVDQLTRLNIKKKAALKEPVIFSQIGSLTEYHKESNNFVSDLFYSAAYSTANRLASIFNLNSDYFQNAQKEKREHEDKNHNEGPQHKKHRH